VHARYARQGRPVMQHVGRRRRRGAAGVRSRERAHVRRQLGCQLGLDAIEPELDGHQLARLHQ
jgi:hypothetical protein